ncbi:hypothetical protein BU17DRAFT_98723 [Hysterangium stoloniferum]|nr:hypothetical protein BU17DRAFT_98723 [Hysterangium stoloniferum]
MDDDDDMDGWRAFVPTTVIISFAKLLATSLVALATIPSAQAETHTVIFTNNCGFGTPLLKANGKTLSTGGPFTSGGPLHAAIA